MDGSKIKIGGKENIKQFFEKLRETAERGNVAAVLKPLIWAIAALLISGTELTLGVAPFGIAMICASNGFIQTSAALCGAVLGTFGVGMQGIWQIAICVGVYVCRLAVSYIGRKRKKFTSAMAFNEKIFMRTLVAACAAVAAGAVSVMSGSNVYYDVFAAIIGLALYPAFTYGFVLVGSAGESQSRRMAGLCSVLYAATLTVYQWGLPFNPGAVLALCATVVVTFANGAIQGATAGLFCGIAMEAVYAPLYPLAAFAVGLIKEHSRPWAVVAASSVGMCWALRLGGFEAMGDLLPELLFASAVMAPLANLGIFPKREFFQKPKEICPPEDIKGRELENRMGKLSVSLSDISELLINVSDKVQRPPLAEAEGICRSAKNKYCQRCIHRDICGGIESAEVSRFFKSMIKKLSDTGTISANLVPARLASRCHNMDGMMEFVNTAAKINGKLAAENCKTRLYASDYKAIAALLREAARPDEDIWARDREAEFALRSSFSDMGVEFSGVSVYGRRNRKIYFRGMRLPNTAGEEDLRKEGERIAGGRLSAPQYTIDGGVVSAYMYSVPKFKIEGGRFSSAGEREKFSGDTVTSFENEEGYYYTLVSDGMGSGREAALTSGISAVFLEKLLMAGAPMKSALEMLNSFICGGEGECFTTVDLMEADIYTGKVSFIKSGAAPSFVLRDGKVFRLHSKTVPIGIIRALDAEIISFDVKEGDRIIMMSDGVTGSYEACPWLYELLESCELTELSPASAARRIGEAAAQATGKEDDITVAVLKILGV